MEIPIARPLLIAKLESYARDLGVCDPQYADLVSVLREAAKLLKPDAASPHPIREPVGSDAILGYGPSGSACPACDE